MEKKKKIQFSLSEKIINRIEELQVANGFINASAIVSIAVEKYYWQVAKEQSKDIKTDGGQPRE
jgi:metal-responsive CopG/Arc/MetJ family transcriptional regulator